MVLIGLVIALLGILLWSSSSKVSALPDTPIVDLGAVDEAKLILEGSGITVPESIDPSQPKNPLVVPTKTVVVEQIGVTLTVPTGIETKEQMNARLGLKASEIPTYSTICDQVNLELGGSYVKGVLTPPKGWSGSVTEWSRYVQQVGLQRYNELKV